MKLTFLLLIFSLFILVINNSIIQADEEIQPLNSLTGTGSVKIDDQLCNIQPSKLNAFSLYIDRYPTIPMLGLPSPKVIPLATFVINKINSKHHVRPSIERLSCFFSIKVFPNNHKKEESINNLKFHSEFSSYYRIKLESTSTELINKQVPYKNIRLYQWMNFAHYYDHIEGYGWEPSGEPFSTGIFFIGTDDTGYRK